MNSNKKSAAYDDIYKNTCEKSFQSNNFCNMRYEKQMDYLFEILKDDFINKKLKVLDACCGYGRLIHFLNKFDENQDYFGIDYSKILIDNANKNFSKYKNIKFEIGDIYKLNPDYENKFDITINYKTLSWLPYYEKCIKELIKVTNGKIYITSLFNDGDYDSICKIYDKASINDEKYTHLNTYSLKKFEAFCNSLGAKIIDCIDMHIDFDLPKPAEKDEISTYTLSIANNERLEITANTILNWKLVVIDTNKNCNSSTISQAESLMCSGFAGGGGRLYLLRRSNLASTKNNVKSIFKRAA